ncbi:hypothetical protein Tco_1360223 [Tanacetum coccineum]
MVKNSENEGKFLMYPRFIQVCLDKQVEGMQSHKEIYEAPCHTKKIFANMRRQGKDFSGRVTPLFPTMMVQAQQEQVEGSDIPTDPHHTPIIIPPSTSQPQRKQRPRKPKRNDTKIPQSSVPMVNVADKDVYKEREDRMERTATTASSLEAEQDSGNINRTQSIATLNEPSPQGTGSGSGPRCQDTILGDAEAQTRFETASKQSNDPPLSRVNTLGSGEDRLQLKEFMDLCIKLSNRVLNLEITKSAQAKEIDNLKKRVKKLKKKKKSRTHRLRRLYKEDVSKQGRRILDIDADEDITLDSTHFDTNLDMFGVHDLEGDEVIVEHIDASAGEKVKSEKVVEEVVSTAKVSAAATITTEEITLAQALAALKSAKPKVDKVVSQKLEQGITKSTATPTTATTTATTKGILLQEPKPLKMKKKDQVLFDEQEAIRLQAQFDEEVKLEREKEEANAALIAQWNDIQDKVETNYELAQRLQVEEQEELTIKEKSKLFVQLLEERKKHFAAKRAE